MQNAVDQLLGLYERRGITRRALVEALAALALGSPLQGQTASDAAGKPAVHARTLNHVSLTTADLTRSKNFYRRLTGLTIRDQGTDFCEFQLDGGFLGLYAPESGHRRPGFDHYCLGIENYDAKRVLADLRQAMPETRPTVEYGDQVYVRDPDGVLVQLGDVSYKR